MAIIDLRSDTVTRPSGGMRRAIADAEVGDDVYGEDPTVLALQERVAEMLGKAAALFVPSGTMANQIALRAQTQPGDQVVVEADCHILRYEAAAPATLSGLQLTPLHADDGCPRWAQVEEALNPDDPHCAPPSLLCLENTHNRRGGRVLPFDPMVETAEGARSRGLAVHLDGARLWNAAAASGHSLAVLAAPFDSVNVCFSKGLGAPIGSMVVGSPELIRRAIRIRKQWGGGMRQVGVLAAACLYALDHHLPRLPEDHAHARQLAEQIDSPRLRPVGTPDTNILLYDVVGEDNAFELADHCRERGLRISVVSARRIRLVTHRDVDGDDCRRAAEILGSLGEERP